MKKIVKSKWFTFGTYILLLMATSLAGFVLLQNNSTLNNVIESFFEVAENRSFDYRQTLKVAHQKPIPNKDIMILAIDDASFEYLWNKYGEWPVPRDVYAKIINHIEQGKPNALIFDLMFIKSMRKNQNSDAELIKAMNSYNNIYTGMNFDLQPSEVRLPVDLPEKLKLKVENNSNVNFSTKYNYTNCRTILNELLQGNAHIGITNVMRSSDGIIRKVSPLLMYKGEYYPYLSFGAGLNYLAQKDVKEIIINQNSKLKLANGGEIPLNKDGEATLNWYGQSGTHTIIPLYKVVKEIENNTHNINFENKIIFIGTTAMSLYDTKSVPIQESIYPGVEVQATFLNNMIDNNFIKKTPVFVNVLILIAVITIIGFIVMSCSSSIIATLSTILFTIAYLFISYYAMELYNLWIPVVIPTILIVFSFALSFLVKYLIKSRDFEYQYRLATVDGLTELYNHRYFQDSLKQNIDLAKRYSQEFSLIIVDIDFFKKFNDTYGHQAGDAVLRQVAQTIKKNFRTTDVVCRYGGEEMSIILPNTNAEEALILAKRICNTVAEKPFQLNEKDKSNVTISLGVATFPQNGEEAQALIEHADKGLYYAKEHGRNQVGRVE